MSIYDKIYTKTITNKDSYLDQRVGELVMNINSLNDLLIHNNITNQQTIFGGIQKGLVESLKLQFKKHEKNMIYKICFWILLLFVDLYLLFVVFDFSLLLNIVFITFDILRIYQSMIELSFQISINNKILKNIIHDNNFICACQKIYKNLCQ